LALYLSRVRSSDLLDVPDFVKRGVSEIHVCAPPRWPITSPQAHPPTAPSSTETQVGNAANIETKGAMTPPTIAKTVANPARLRAINRRRTAWIPGGSGIVSRAARAQIAPRHPMIIPTPHRTKATATCCHTDCPSQNGVATAANMSARNATCTTATIVRRRDAELVAMYV